MFRRRTGSGTFSDELGSSRTETRTSKKEKSIISVKDSSKRYARNTAVDHISFEGREGADLGFLGPNGAKDDHDEDTDLLSAPSSGTVTVAGFDVLEAPLRSKSASAICQRRGRFNLEMRTAEYLTFCGAA